VIYFIRAHWAKNSACVQTTCKYQWTTFLYTQQTRKSGGRRAKKCAHNLPNLFHAHHTQLKRPWL